MDKPACRQEFQIADCKFQIEKSKNNHYGKRQIPKIKSQTN
jgi:hypothetical protein